MAKTMQLVNGRTVLGWGAPAPDVSFPHAPQTVHSMSPVSVVALYPSALAGPEKDLAEAQG